MRALASPLDPAFYAGLEELLLAGDVGPSLAARLTDSVRRRKPLTLEEARAALEAEVVAALSAKPRSLELAANPSVVLLYGVNGAGYLPDFFVEDAGVPGSAFAQNSDIEKARRVLQFGLRLSF